MQLLEAREIHARVVISRSVFAQFQVRCLVRDRGRGVSEAILPRSRVGAGTGGAARGMVSIHEGARLAYLTVDRRRIDAHVLSDAI
jgi:hypothetical protein